MLYKPLGSNNLLGWDGSPEGVPGAQTIGKVQQWKKLVGDRKEKFKKLKGESWKKFLPCN